MLCVSYASLRRAVSWTSLAPPSAARSGAVAHLRRCAFRDRLDRLRETGFRWGGSGAAVLSGARHASGRDQQPPLDRLRRRARDLSVEGLRARASVALDDSHRDGIPPALRAAHSAAGLCPHSAVWLPGQHVSHRHGSRSPGGYSGGLRPARRRRSCPRGTVRDAARRWSSGRSSLPRTWPWSPSASTRHECPPTSSRPASSSPWSPTPQKSCASIRLARSRRHTPDPHARGRSACRRRSRADGPEVHTGPRPKIPIPAPIAGRRQRLPSSLVIESASASTSSPRLSSVRRNTPPPMASVADIRTGAHAAV